MCVDSDLADGVRAGIVALCHWLDASRLGAGVGPGKEDGSARLTMPWCVRAVDTVSHTRKVSGRRLSFKNGPIY